MTSLLFSSAYRIVFAGALYAVSLLTGCTVNPVAVDNATLKPNQGLLVMQIKSNAFAKLNFSEYDSHYGFATRLKHELLTGSAGYVVADRREKKYVVMPVNAGEYMWTNFEAYPKMAEMNQSNKFTIVANSITYIGQLDIFIADMRYSLRVTDQVDDMRKHLAGTFPGYLQSMPVVTNLADLHLDPK